ncbi:MAG: T9SS type A sorting domain-containing protein [Ignavibacteria bacterium]|nr:T9SS type A sorting domain-containing protein [Ignavibacteria bacterium]
MHGEDQKPTVFYLHQNYPNPFNPSTVIRWQLPQKLSGSFVTLKVYDILGKEVATLVNEEQKAGNYSINFDATTSAFGGKQLTTNSLPSGIYLYQLRAGGFMETRKMVVLR